MKKTPFFFLICTVAAAITLGCNNSPTSQREIPDSTAPAPMPTPETAAFNAGTFKGTIPGGARKRDVSITFNADSTFNMKESYLSKEGKPEHEMDNTGKWSYDGVTKSIYLAYKNLADRGTSFAIVDDNTIQLQDHSIQAPGQAEKTGGPEYTLRRQQP
ncbi:copper resistance protein NlpE N-terminal domain-containing protein [Chitinophaga varians]|uniref:copper resistance protein NlpE N-terminal domain-containing protein n=1 Tax=Chitinophaga varians TaxID=2202339 RepID=UPI00165FB080|nr:copper resistance protein NlpE N-terminal domain-containing protein [Chitinophaga varians]MBC9912981.1 copper resistance protein NlpE N-terminal domain-containing protein [Chitinophaga varians]